MKIILSGDVKIVMSNPAGMHNYFGWPTAAKLQNGKIAVAASQARLPVRKNRDRVQCGRR